MSYQTAPGKIRAVCDHCRHHNRATNPSKTHWYDLDQVSAAHDGSARISTWELPRGWSIAPYPAYVQHHNGTTGDQHMCSRCARLRMAQ